MRQTVHAGARANGLVKAFSFEPKRQSTTDRSRSSPPARAKSVREPARKSMHATKPLPLIAPRPIPDSEGQRVVVHLGHDDDEGFPGWVLLLDWDDGDKKWQEQCFSYIPADLAQELTHFSHEGSYVTHATFGRDGEWFVEAEDPQTQEKKFAVGDEMPNEDLNAFVNEADDISVVAMGGDLHRRSWVVVNGKNVFSHGDAYMRDSPLAKRMERMKKQKKDIHNVCLSWLSGHGYFILDQSGTDYSGLGEELSDEIERADGVVHICESGSGHWIVIRNYEVTFSGGIPADLQKKLAHFFKKQSYYRRIRDSEIEEYENQASREQENKLRRKSMQVDMQKQADMCSGAARSSAKRHGFGELCANLEKHVIGFVKGAGVSQGGILRVDVYIHTSTVITYFLREGLSFSPLVYRNTSTEKMDELFGTPCMAGRLCRADRIPEWGIDHTPVKGDTVTVRGAGIALPRKATVQSANIITAGENVGKYAIDYADGTQSHVDPDRLSIVSNIASEVDILSKIVIHPVEDREALFAHLCMKGCLPLDHAIDGNIIVRRLFLDSGKGVGAKFSERMEVEEVRANSPALAAEMAPGDQWISATFPVTSSIVFGKARPRAGGQFALLGLVRAGNPFDLLAVGDDKGSFGMYMDAGQFPKISTMSDEDDRLKDGDRIATMTVPIESPEHWKEIKNFLHPGTPLTIATLRPSTQAPEEQMMKIGF